MTAQDWKRAGLVALVIVALAGAAFLATLFSTPEFH